MIIEIGALIVSILASAAVAYAVVAVVCVVTFAICAVADAIWQKFKEKQYNNAITIANAPLGKVMEALSEKSPETFKKLENALDGKNGKFCLYRNAKGEVEELAVLRANDASVDEMEDVMRFNSDGRIIGY